METVETAYDPQSTHNIKLKQSQQAPGFQYYRFNPERTEHLLDIPFDDWLPRHASKGNASGFATLNAIRTAFDSWCSNDESVNAYFEECAQALVRQRRLRLQNRAKWERYAIAAAFTCQQKFCDKQDRTWTDVFDFERHLEAMHGIKGDDLDSEKSRARWPWQYRQAKLNGGEPGEKKKRRWGVL